MTTPRAVKLSEAIDNTTRDLFALAERVREEEGQNNLYYAVNRAWHELWFEAQKGAGRAALRSREGE